MSNITHPTKPLALVNVSKQKDSSCEIEVCFLPFADFYSGKNRKAFLGLDASLSMRAVYGHACDYMGPYVGIIARKLGATLARFPSTGKVDAAYWAVGIAGDKTEWIGDFNEAEWSSVQILGPNKEQWGKGTRLLPVLRHVVESVHTNSDWTIAVMVTDGTIEDEDACMAYCRQFGKRLTGGRAGLIQMLLLGVGDGVDQPQFERISEGMVVDSPSLAFEVDTGLVASHRDESSILEFLYFHMMKETIVGAIGWVESGSGKELVAFTDGIPGIFSFTLPKGETLFRIHADEHVVEQDCSEVLARL